MTIEIHRPELEALIRQRMKTGAFPTVEDALMQALRASPLPGEQDASVANQRCSLTGAELVAAMQASPYKDIDLEPTRGRPRVRDVRF
jgi:hypothetical protein